VAFFKEVDDVTFSKKLIMIKSIAIACLAMTSVALAGQAFAAKRQPLPTPPEQQCYGAPCNEKFFLARANKCLA
jgi:hypothetical protein